MSFPMIKYMLEQAIRSAEKSKTLLTHCFGYSLDLAVKDVTSNCEILGDGVGTVKEITVLVKFSPKREKMLGSLIENVEGVEENETISNKGEYLDELCATGWTFKAKRFQKTITNYSDIQMSRRNFDRRSARKDSWTSRSNDHF